MTKNEHAALVALYTKALQLNRDSSFRYPHATYQFMQGYEWGIAQALEALGFTWAERYDIWDAVTSHAHGEP